jgi:archaellum component FlaC
LQQRDRYQQSQLLNIMTSATDSDITGQKTVLDAIERLDHKIEQLDSKVEKLEGKVDGFNEKFDYYQKASQSVVNLAFGLIASATIVTLAQTIFRR